MNMQLHTDNLGNKWRKVDGSYELKGIPEKLNTYVWFKGTPGCEWTTPHIEHIVSVETLLRDHANAEEIWLWEQPKKKISDTLLASIIGGIALIIATLIGLFGKDDKHTNSSPTVHQEVNGAKNITVQGDHNTILVHHDKDWEWEDLNTIKDGDTLQVRVVFKIITDDFRWKLGEHEYLDNGEKVYQVLPQFLSTLPNFKNAIGVIAVGMASEEGVLDEEVRRADRRADQIVMAINQNETLAKKYIYKLNLGQHKSTSVAKRDADATSYQRKITLIGIMNWSGGRDVFKLKDCLREVLKESKALSFPSNSYSNFDLYDKEVEYEKKFFK